MEKLTEKQVQEYEESSTCFICNKIFTNNVSNPKVRDHCHITGKFRGAAHSRCNLNFQLPNFIPIIFHNLSGYDSHLFIKQLATEEEDVYVIPSSTEKYITFGKSVLVDEILNDKGKREKKYIRLRFIEFSVHGVFVRHSV